MPMVVDADTHIIEHPGVWEEFDREVYHRRPRLASTATDPGSDRPTAVWMVDKLLVDNPRALYGL